MTIPRFLVESGALDDSRVVLTGGELRHVRARRLRPGSAVVISDAVGRQRRGVIATLQRHEAIIEFVDGVEPIRESPLRVTLAQAVLKPAQLDFVVEKATELGVAEIILFTCARTQRPASESRMQRLQRVANSAAKQCQRSAVPHIAGTLTFSDLLCRPTDSLGLFFWEASATVWDSPAIHAPRDLLAVVGPEGGFTPTEAAAACTAGFRQIGLGPRILRAETAAVVALTLCQFFWGDLNNPTLAAALPRP